MPNAVWKKYKDFAQKNDRLRLHSETLGTFLHDARDPHRFHFPRYFLNAVLPGNDYHFGKDITGDANRGIDMKPNLHEDTSYADTEE